MQIKHTKYILLTIFLVIIIIFSSVIVYKYATFEAIVEYKDEVKEFSQNNMTLTFILFLIAVIVFNNLPVPFSVISKLFGGFIYGFVLGAIINILFTFISAMVGFYTSRYLFRDHFQKRFQKHLKLINSETQNFGFYYFLSLRIFFAFPYFILNILGGISKLTKKQFALSAFLGTIPSSLLYAYAGERIDLISTPQDIISIEILLLFIIIASVPLIIAILKHRNSKQ